MFDLIIRQLITFCTIKNNEVSRHIIVIFIGKYYFFECNIFNKLNMHTFLTMVFPDFFIKVQCNVIEFEIKHFFNI
mgnify:CR=1 FL=1